MNTNLKLLGHKVEDLVTGFKGVVTSVSFDLYGCVQAVVTPGASADKKKEDYERSRWFDVKRLKQVSKEPVMAAPSFVVVPGPEDKPLPR